VKVEVWDVVDHAIIVDKSTSDSIAADMVYNLTGEGTFPLMLHFPFPLCLAASHKAISLFWSSFTQLQNLPLCLPTVEDGRHAIVPVDASVVDIYKDSHAVIFLINPSSVSSLEYVR